jgi:hypothetical protein
VRALILSILNEALSCSSCRELEFREWVDVEELGYPNLPALDGPLWRSLYLSMAPYVPGVTGNEEEARRLVEKIGLKAQDTFNALHTEALVELMRQLGDRLIRGNFRGDYLDKLLIGHRRWINGGGLLDTLLALESQLGLWEYTVGTVKPLLDPNTAVRLTEGTVNNYAKAIGAATTRLLDHGRLLLDQGSPTLIDRVCSIASFSNVKNYVLATAGDEWGILCTRDDASGRILEVSERALIYRRRDYTLAFVDSNSLRKLVDQELSTHQ